MSIGLSDLISSGVVNINSCTPIDVKEPLYISADGGVFLRTGYVETDTEWYPDATLNTCSIATAVQEYSYYESRSNSETNGFHISEDGLRMYVSNGNLDQVLQYNLSVAHDLSTAVYTNALSVGYNVSGIFVTPDGSSFIVATFEGYVKSFSLPTPFELTGAVETYSFRPYSETYDVCFNSDGTIMILGIAGQALEYNLSTPYDLTTAVASGEKISISGNFTAVSFSADGKKFFHNINESSTVYEYDLITPYRIATSQFHLYSSLIGSLAGLQILSDNTILYASAAQVSSVRVYKFSLTPNFIGLANPKTDSDSALPLYLRIK